MKQIFLFSAFVLLLTVYSCKDKTEVKSLNLKGDKAIKPTFNWIYKNKQIAYFDSVYCKTFGPDTAAARFTLFLMDATTLCNLIKIYPDSNNSLVLIAITEFANDKGKLKVESFNRIQQPYTIKLEKQINYLALHGK